MTAPRNNLSAPERFRVANYLIAHIDELRALPSNVARARHVGEALGLSMTASNLTKAAEAACVTLTPPPKPKPAPGGVVAALLRELLARTEAAEAALVRANDYSKALERRINTLEATATLVRTHIPINSYASYAPHGSTSDGTRTTLL